MTASERASSRPEIGNRLRNGHDKDGSRVCSGWSCLGLAAVPVVGNFGASSFPVRARKSSALSRRTRLGQNGQMSSPAARGSEVLRYAAFTDEPSGGNPAGVVLDARGLDEGRMLQIAREVGYSETAFLRSRRDRPGAYDVRYFSLEAEVPFCGHATIAAGVALTERDGPGELVFHVSAGPVVLRTRREPSGAATASLTSVPPDIEETSAEVLGEALSALGWRSTELDPALPPRIAYAGARHLILAAASRSRLASLEYEFERLKRLMLDLDLTTSISSGARATIATTPATHFRLAASTRTRQPALPQPRSAATCALSASSSLQ